MTIRRTRNYGWSAMLVILLLTLLAPAASAQDQPDLSDLSLEDLLNITVTSATKVRAMEISKAPGVMYVFTRAEIASLGMKTLRDVLVNVPSVQIQERAGHSAVWIRGVKQRFNNKVLWLIDGVPLRDGYYGHHGVDEIVPLDMVERIEIIAGPGSVLYGTNAFTGVVSVTTRRAENMRERSAQAKVGYGTYDSKNASVEFGRGPFYLYADYINSQGFSPTINTDGNIWKHNQDRKRTFASIKFDKDAFRGSFTVIDQEYADQYRRQSRNQTIDRNPKFGSLAYRKELGARFAISSLGYYGYYSLSKDDLTYDSNGKFESAESDTFDTSLGGGDLEISYFSTKHTILTGVSVQVDQSHRMSTQQIYPLSTPSNSLAVSNVNRTDVAAYAQHVWAISPHISMTGGIRYDRLSDFKDEASYRVGLIGDHAGYYGKLLYGTAFRVPSYREYLDVETYNFGLQPEHLHTFEAQIGRTFSRADVNLTFYDNRYTDLIKEIVVDMIATPTEVRVVDDEYSINADKASIRGLELEARFIPFQGLSVLLGASRILHAKEKVGDLDLSITPSAKLELGETDTAFLAKYTTSARVTYRFPNRGHEVGLNATGISRRRTPVDYQSDVPAENVNLQNAKGFMRLDLFSSFRISPQIGLALKMENALNGQFYSPPFDSITGYDYEWPGRTFRIELTLRK